MTHPKDVVGMIEGAGGEVESMTVFDDGHGVATASFPLPQSHWLYADDGSFDAPPMPMRMGTDDPRRKAFNDMVRAAARYAVRAATMKGTESGIDPDALVQNMVVGLLGYHTPDGLCGMDDWANPKPVPPPFTDGHEISSSQ